MNQFRPVTMISRTTPGTHDPRISVPIVTNRFARIVERPPYTMYVLYATFFFAQYILTGHMSTTTKMYLFSVDLFCLSIQ